MVTKEIEAMYGHISREHLMAEEARLAKIAEIFEQAGEQMTLNRKRQAQKVAEEAKAFNIDDFRNGYRLPQLPDEDPIAYKERLI